MEIRGWRDVHDSAVIRLMIWKRVDSGVVRGSPGIQRCRRLPCWRSCGRGRICVRISTKPIFPGVTVVAGTTVRFPFSSDYFTRLPMRRPGIWHEEYADSSHVRWSSIIEAVAVRQACHRLDAGRQPEFGVLRSSHAVCYRLPEGAVLRMVLDEGRSSTATWRPNRRIPTPA